MQKKETMCEIKNISSSEDSYSAEKIRVGISGDINGMSGTSMEMKLRVSVSGGADQIKKFFGKDLILGQDICITISKGPQSTLEKFDHETEDDEDDDEDDDHVPDDDDIEEKPRRRGRPKKA